MKIIFSQRCLEYCQPGHPESPERINDTYKFLKENGFEFIEPKPCTDENILLVHTEELLNKVKQGAFFDPDTPNLPNIIEYAKLSAGAAIRASELAIGGEFVFSLMRPPGHHATKNNLGGFCYFNNIAIAIRKVGKRTAIIDIDCHHGNGTEDIFLGSQEVLYISLHQSPLYPGTGLSSKQNSINFPLPSGTEETDYLNTLEKGIKEVERFNPLLIGVSAGFDTYIDDPLTGLCLTKQTYKKIGEMIKELGKPTFALLEGGYSKDMPYCVYEFLLGVGS